MAGKSLDPRQRAALLDTLRARFEKHPQRHPKLEWKDVEARLTPERLYALQQMEETGGEPDVVVLSGSPCYADCAAESPSGRRSLCYDDQALNSRKENKPRDSAAGLAAAWGVRLMDEAQYRELQALFPFDMKTSSWVASPAAMRSLGGALFCDRRYDMVFVYHNGAESYYAGRGFRAVLPL